MYDGTNGNRGSVCFLSLDGTPVVIDSNLREQLVAILRGSLQLMHVQATER